MTPLVHFEAVDKIYRRGAERANLRAALPGRLGRVVDPNGFWALRGVHLAAQEGEILGVIGPNGAGKSTLLKLVARTIAPSRGRVQTTGRIASLIELGVGFHPDLTGSDNVRFSAAVLGMSRAAVARRYDEIVAFAGIESFMGTPVKRYSSGMLARLGFAVAVHLDAEIVLVDEVLSVGDAAFQRKGFQRMKEMQRSGATLLFVTHNLLMVPEICQRAVRIEAGTIVDDGAPAGVVERYMAHAASYASGGTPAGPQSGVQIVGASLSRPAIRPGEALGLALQVVADRGYSGARITVVITTLDGVHTAGLDLPGSTEALASAGSFVLEGQIDAVLLAPGSYRVLFTVLEEVEGAALTLHQAATTLSVIGDLDLRQYGPAYLAGSFQVTHGESTAKNLSVDPHL